MRLGAGNRAERSLETGECAPTLSRVVAGDLYVYPVRPPPMGPVLWKRGSIRADAGEITGSALRLCLGGGVYTVVLRYPWYGDADSGFGIGRTPGFRGFSLGVCLPLPTACAESV